MNETDEEEKFKQENLKNNWKLLENILLEVQNATSPHSESKGILTRKNHHS